MNIYKHSDKTLYFYSKDTPPPPVLLKVDGLIRFQNFQGMASINSPGRPPKISHSLPFSAATGSSSGSSSSST